MKNWTTLKSKIINLFPIEVLGHVILITYTVLLLQKFIEPMLAFGIAMALAVLIEIADYFAHGKFSWLDIMVSIVAGFLTLIFVI